MLGSHASRPQDAALGTGLWLPHPGAPLLLELQEESPQAPEERYFFPILSLFQDRALFSAALCSRVGIGCASETEPWETVKLAQGQCWGLAAGEGFRETEW